jgi:hypothetical protein
VNDAAADETSDSPAAPGRGLYLGTCLAFMICVGAVFGVVATTVHTRPDGNPYCTCGEGHRPPGILDDFMGGRHHHGSEASAIGSLKAISAAQSLHREGDKDGDGTLDYATLSELARENLVDQVLGSGTKYGYAFATAAGNADSEARLYTWWATAVPTCASFGDRSFAICQEGVVHYTKGGSPLQPDPGNGAMPKHAIPVGQ